MRSKLPDRRFTAFGFGVLFLFILLEASIRIIGFIYHQEAEEMVEAHAYRILMLGNSHTYGVGVEKHQTYSGVLEKFFREEVPGYKVEVINEGLMNGNTRFVLSHIDDILDNYQPHLSVVLAGEPNIWNKYGYTDYLRERSHEVKISFLIKEFLGHSRVFRWMFTFKEYIPSEKKLPQDQDNDLQAYRILARYERNASEEFFENQIPHIHSTLSLFVERHEHAPPPAWRSFLLLLARIELEQKQNPQKAFDLLKRSVSWKPQSFDYFVFKYLKEKNFEGAEELRSILAKTYPGDETYKLWERAEAMDPQLIRQHPQFVEMASDAYPEKTRMTFLLSWIYKSDLVKLAKLYARTIEANPLQSSMAEIFDIDRFETKNKIENAEIRKLLAETKLNFTRKLPSEVMVFDEVSQDALSEWVHFDLQRIKNKIRDAKSNVCFLNYHHLNLPSLAEEIQKPIRKVAESTRCGLIDLRSIFQDELNSPVASDRTLFASKYYVKDNHPGVDGHRIIARVIYDHLNANRFLPEKLRNLDSRRIYKFAQELEGPILVGP